MCIEYCVMVQFEVMNYEISSYSRRSHFHVTIEVSVTRIKVFDQS